MEKTIILICDKKQMKDGIESIRGLFPMKRSEIDYRTQKLREDLKKGSAYVAEEDLTHMGRYGVMEFSLSATAFHPVSKDQLPYHGNVYMTVWTWDAENRWFFTNTALGEVPTRKPSAMPMPIVKL